MEVNVLRISYQSNNRKNVLFLRGNSITNMIGSTDIEIAYSLTGRYNIYILAQKKLFGFDTKKIGRATIIETPYLNIPYFGAFLFNILSFIKLRKFHFDVIIVNHGLFIAAHLYNLTHKTSKVVLDIRSIPVDSTGLRLFVNNMCLRYSLNSNILSGITVITESMYNYLIEKNLVNSRLPVAFWSSGVNKSIFMPIYNNSSKYIDKSAKSFIVTYHGSLSKSRGILNLIKAVGLLVEEGFENLKLLLVGSGKDEDYFKEEVLKLGIDDYVKFTGLIPYNEVPTVISIADLAVIPFPKSEFWEYQSPMKIFEYMAMGIPIIATDLQAHEHISDGITLMPDNSPETISHYIKNFIKLDLISRKNLEKIAIKDSNKYTWENQANILSEYLEKNVL
jgi:glycosyltransferase involved in cell wall biosynthesis